MVESLSCSLPGHVREKQRDRVCACGGSLRIGRDASAFERARASIHRYSALERENDGTGGRLTGAKWEWSGNNGCVGKKNAEGQRNEERVRLQTTKTTGVCVSLICFSIRVRILT